MHAHTHTRTHTHTHTHTHAHTGVRPDVRAPDGRRGTPFHDDRQIPGNVIRIHSCECVFVCVCVCVYVCVCVGVHTTEPDGGRGTTLTYDRPLEGDCNTTLTPLRHQCNATATPLWCSPPS
jgi:hypothetical protein